MQRLCRWLFVAMSLFLAGCETEGCRRDELNLAAQYRVKQHADGSLRYEQSLNEWVAHPRLAQFIREAIRTDGIDGLQTKHGFRCTPRPHGGACSDCQTCTLSLRQLTFQHRLITPACYYDGDMQIRAEIGPGTAVSVMSYWKPLD